MFSITSESLRYVVTCILNQDRVWITFDERISDNVLGMDILNKLAILQYDNTNEMLLFADKAELQKYVINEIG